MSDQTPELVELAGSIVAAYVSNNSVPPGDLPALIANIHAAVTRVASGASAASDANDVEEVQKPSAAQIRKSVTDEGIVSFIDGRTYKTLKRHLTTHGLDPRSYRQRYDLPDDYPMVAPSYAAQRSALARQIGLGRPGALAERQKAVQATGRSRKAA